MNKSLELGAKSLEQENAEKLEKSLIDMRAKLERIADLALAADAKCGTCDMIGQNWMTCSKALCEIRDLCGPSLAEKAEPAAEVPRTRTQEEYIKEHYSLCDGLFSIRRGNSEQCVVEHVWIGERRFTCETVVTDKVDGVNRKCEFTIRDNGRICCSGHYYGGKAIAEKVAHAAMKEYVRNLSGGGKYSSRGGFLKQAVKRVAAAKGVK